MFVPGFIMLIINMILEAVVISRIIRPAMEIHLSDGAVFDPAYGLKKTPHILFRLINTSHFDVYDVSLKAFLTIRNDDPDNADISMVFYLAVPYLDPMEVPVLRTNNPWIVATPAATAFENSIIHDYPLNLHKKEASHKGKRQPELLVSGIENAASSSFLSAFTINLEPEGEHPFTCGRFKSLPCHMKKHALKNVHVHNSNSEDQALGKGCQFEPNVTSSRKRTRLRIKP